MPRKKQEEEVPVAPQGEAVKMQEVPKKSALAQAYEDFVESGESGRSNTNKILKAIVERLEG